MDRIRDLGLRWYDGVRRSTPDEPFAAVAIAPQQPGAPLPIVAIWNPAPLISAYRAAVMHQISLLTISGAQPVLDSRM